jgi:hypothetical protein
VVGVDQAGEPATEALTRLRAAAAAVADLDRPTHDPPLGDAIPGDTTPGETAPGETVTGETVTDAGFDATAHADRFSELHDALVTVLADVDRG